jgi:mannitol/fructose-specific phosphotransferase system IIA component (Ntr-type)
MLDARPHPTDAVRGSRARPKSKTPMKLTELLVPEAVSIDFPAAPMEKLLAALVRDLQHKGFVADPERATADIVARERVMSTGVGNGVAIPHAYTDAVDRVVAGFYRTREAVEFAAPDGAPVDLFFVVFGPRASQRDHIRFLARISRLLKNAEFRDALRAAPDADAVHMVFRRFGDR